MSAVTTRLLTCSLARAIAIAWAAALVGCGQGTLRNVAVSATEESAEPVQECKNSSECESGEVCDLLTGTCETKNATTCKSDSECTSAKPRCNVSTGVCQAIDGPPDFQACADTEPACPDGFVCVTEIDKCAPDCRTAIPACPDFMPTCDESTGLCGPCTGDGCVAPQPELEDCAATEPKCAEGFVCVAEVNKCAPAQPELEDCAATEPKCDAGFECVAEVNKCAPVQPDFEDCAATEPKCDEGFECLAGPNKCVPILEDCAATEPKCDEGFVCMAGPNKCVPQ